MYARKNTNDIASGILLSLVAIAGFTLSWPLDSFSSYGIGPGYVPKAFSLVLGALGVAVAVHGFFSSGGPLEAWHARPLFFVLGSIAFFGLAIEPLGLIVALLGMVILSSAAHRRARVHDTIALAGFAAIFCFLVFIQALRLPFPVWPTFPEGL